MKISAFYHATGTQLIHKEFCTISFPVKQLAMIKNTGIHNKLVMKWYLRTVYGKRKIFSEAQTANNGVKIIIVTACSYTVQ